MAKVQSEFQLHMPAGKATPAPPIGPILWQHGINIGGFVKEFNDKTADYPSKYGGMDIKLPVNVRIFVDRSYEMEIQPPVTSNLILWKANVKQGSWEPNKSPVGSITRADLEEIAEIKKPVMNTDDVNKIMNTIEWTAKNMWVKIED